MTRPLSNHMHVHTHNIGTKGAIPDKKADSLKTGELSGREVTSEDPTHHTVKAQEVISEAPHHKSTHEKATISDKSVLSEKDFNIVDLENKNTTLHETVKDTHKTGSGILSQDGTENASQSLGEQEEEANYSPTLQRGADKLHDLKKRGAGKFDSEIVYRAGGGMTSSAPETKIADSNKLVGTMTKLTLLGEKLRATKVKTVNDLAREDIQALTPEYLSLQSDHALLELGAKHLSNFPDGLLRRLSVNGEKRLKEEQSKFNEAVKKHAADPTKPLPVANFTDPLREVRLLLANVGNEDRLAAGKPKATELKDLLDNLSEQGFADLRFNDQDYKEISRIYLMSSKITGKSSAIEEAKGPRPSPDIGSNPEARAADIEKWCSDIIDHYGIKDKLPDASSVTIPLEKFPADRFDYYCALQLKMAEMIPDEPLRPTVDLQLRGKNCTADQKSFGILGGVGPLSDAEILKKVMEGLTPDQRENVKIDLLSMPPPRSLEQKTLRIINYTSNIVAWGQREHINHISVTSNTAHANLSKLEVLTTGKMLSLADRVVGHIKKEDEHIREDDPTKKTKTLVLGTKEAYDKKLYPTLLASQKLTPTTVEEK